MQAVKQRYQNRALLDNRTSSDLHYHLVQTGSVRKRTSEERPRTVKTPEIEEAVLQEEHPESSTRNIARHLNICHHILWKILLHFLLYPYHILGVQILLPIHFPMSVAFCEWCLQNIMPNPQFESHVLFTDEANFSRNVIHNFYNNRLWTESWAGIVFFPTHATDEVP